jgi:hypothetical protein
MIRIMAPGPDRAESPNNVTTPGTAEQVMGPYYPRGKYLTKEAFEAPGSRK